MKKCRKHASILVTKHPCVHTHAHTNIHIGGAPLFQFHVCDASCMYSRNVVVPNKLSPSLPPSLFLSLSLTLSGSRSFFLSLSALIKHPRLGFFYLNKTAQRFLRFFCAGSIYPRNTVVPNKLSPSLSRSLRRALSLARSLALFLLAFDSNCSNNCFQHVFLKKKLDCLFLPTNIWVTVTHDSGGVGERARAARATPGLGVCPKRPPRRRSRRSQATRAVSAKPCKGFSSVGAGMFFLGGVFSSFWDRLWVE